MVLEGLPGQPPLLGKLAFLVLVVVALFALFFGLLLNLLFVFLDVVLLGLLVLWLLLGRLAWQGSGRRRAS